MLQNWDEKNNCNYKDPLLAVFVTNEQIFYTKPGFYSNQNQTSIYYETLIAIIKRVFSHFGVFGRHTKNPIIEQAEGAHSN